MVGQTVGYVRVSSAEQNLDRQLEAVGECDRIFQDKISGSSRAKRTGLAELMQYVREGDLVKVASMDRLGRDTRDLYAIVDELTAKGCAVQFVSERITVNKSGTSPVDGLMLGILAAFAEFERRRIKERQAEGIALAVTFSALWRRSVIAICRTHMVAGAGSVRGCQRLVSHGFRDTEVMRRAIGRGCSLEVSDYLTSKAVDTAQEALLMGRLTS